MTDAERHAEWQDPYIQELAEQLKAAIYESYLHRRKNSRPLASVSLHQERDVSEVSNVSWGVSRGHTAPCRKPADETNCSIKPEEPAA